MKKEDIVIIPEKCIHCLGCLAVCPHNVIKLNGNNITINKKLSKFCKKCDHNKECIIFCPTDAIVKVNAK